MIPYSDHSICNNANVPSPNNNPAADSAASVTSHEITETITDPIFTGWYDPAGFEIGDLCAYKDFTTTNIWDAGKANQMWNGDFYALQTEYSNHAATTGAGVTVLGCVALGP